MKFFNVALASTLVLGSLVVSGCRLRAQDDDEATAAAQAQLVADHQEISTADDDLEGGLDEPLSGADPTDPENAPADATSDADFMAKVKSNPGLFFRPAGCITTTLSGHKATHVFDGCTGPYGMTEFRGTVTSTYERANGTLTITHEATGFKINGATISGKRVVTYTRTGSVFTKTRNGDWTGTTKQGIEISHEAAFTSTYDVSSKCVTRNGSAATTIGERELDLTVADYKRCGIGSLGCPESGKVTLSRTKNGETAQVSLEFLGGREYTVTGPRGRSTTFALVCREN